MRILHIVSNISIRNGIMSVIMNYYRKINCSKFNLSFIYFDERENTYADEISSLGGTYTKINKGKNPIELFKAIHKYVKDNNDSYDIIHLHETYLIPTLIGIKKNSNLKIIAHAHSTKFSENALKNMRNMIFSLPNKSIPNYYFSCSKAAGVALFGRKFLENGYVMNNAINLDNFSYDEESRVLMRKKLNIENKIVIGHVGNFNKGKNHSFLIDVFESYLKINKNSVLVLVGDGELKEEIKKKCKQLKIDDKVLFLGVRKDINAIMNAFDCFVLPSKFEGLGVVLIEAQATGLPCVFSDCVPIESNILKDQNKTISLKEKPEKWANTINDLINIRDKNSKKKIQDAGFDISIESKRLEQKYEDIVGGTQNEI